MHEPNRARSTIDRRSTRTQLWTVAAGEAASSHLGLGAAYDVIVEIGGRGRWDEMAPAQAHQARTEKASRAIRAQAQPYTRIRRCDTTKNAITKWTNGSVPMIASATAQRRR